MHQYPSRLIVPQLLLDGPRIAVYWHDSREILSRRSGIRICLLEFDVRGNTPNRQTVQSKYTSEVSRGMVRLQDQRHPLHAAIADL